MLLLFLCFCIMVQVLCVDGVNHYDDIANSRIVVAESSELQDGDTVAAEEEKDLTLAVELFAFIDSFTIDIIGSASWRDTQVTVNENMVNPITFPISFYGNGENVVTITTYYNDGSMKTQTILIYCSKVVDTKGPSITIVYSNMNKDTIITGSVPFTCNVKVQDVLSDLDTGSLRINDEAFDSVVLDNSKTAHGYRTFTQNDLVNAPVMIILYAQDIHKNGSRDTFWIREGEEVPFDSTVTIVRQTPGGDTVTWAVDSLTIEGYVDDINDAGSFYTIRIYRNDTLLPVGSYPSMSSNSWLFNCKLGEEWNSITLVIYPKDDNMLAHPLDSNGFVVHYTGRVSGGQRIRTGEKGKKIIDPIQPTPYTMRKRKNMFADGR